MGWTSELADFYRTRLKPYAVIRVPKEAVWHVWAFVKWRILWLLSFTRQHVIRPLVRAILPRPVLHRLHMLNGRLQGLLISFGKSTLLPLESLLSTSRSTGRIEIFPAGKVVSPRPPIFPARLANKVPELPAEYEFPAISVIEFAEAEITGCSNLVCAGDAVVHHDLYRFSHDATSEELHGRLRIYPSQKLVKRYGAKQADRSLASAAVFTDSCSSNYAHWLTEVLPRIHAFSTLYPEGPVSLFIDAGLHPNIASSARMIAPPGSKFVELAPGEAAHVRKLLVVTPTGYVPFERRYGVDEGHSHGTFSPHAFLSLRARLADLLPAPTQRLPELIMLRRSSGTRALKNEDEIYRRLAPMGFEAIYPERLSFADQFHLFANASVIVGATGAAFANLVFCAPTTRIVICISEHREHSFGYWQSMASAVGNSVTYVLGPLKGSRAHGVHAAFTVDVEDVLHAIAMNDESASPQIKGNSP